jgi:hypothetical protein
MSREDLHFRLRIPEQLKKRVEASAASNERSMTAEIVDRLERSFDLGLSLPSDLESRIRRVAKGNGRTVEEQALETLKESYPAEMFTVEQLLVSYRIQLASEAISADKRDELIAAIDGIEKMLALGETELHWPVKVEVMPKPESRVHLGGNKYRVGATVRYTLPTRNDPGGDHQDEVE